MGKQKNRGKHRKTEEIWENRKTGETGKLGETKENIGKQGKHRKTEGNRGKQGEAQENRKTGGII